MRTWLRTARDSDYASTAQRAQREASHVSHAVAPRAENSN
jgi:hypothetical protein